MAPSHSFDENTLIALKNLVLNLFRMDMGFPYKVKGIDFVPQISSDLLTLALV